MHWGRGVYNNCRGGLYEQFRYVSLSCNATFEASMIRAHLLQYILDEVPVRNVAGVVRHIVVSLRDVERGHLFLPSCYQRFNDLAPKESASSNDKVRLRRRHGKCEQGFVVERQMRVGRFLVGLVQGFALTAF